MKRIYKLNKSVEENYGKFAVVNIWRAWGQEVISNSFWSPNIFDTYEEAENYVKEHYSSGIHKLVIMKIYARFHCKKELVVDVKKDKKRQYAVFANRHDYLIYHGVVEGYDRQDAMNEFHNSWNNKSTARMYVIENGKIKNPRLINKRITLAKYERQKPYGGNFIDVPLKTLR